MTNIPSNCMAMGNPARVIQRGINTIAYGINKEVFEEKRAAEEAKKAASAET